MHSTASVVVCRINMFYAVEISDSNTDIEIICKSNKSSRDRQPTT